MYDKKICLILFTLALSACSTPYPCGEPGSGQCKSVNQNYQQSYTNYVNPDDLDAGASSNSTSATRRVSSNSNNNTNKLVNEYMTFQQYPQIPVSGVPLMSQPKMMRVWLSPYTDNDNIYHDQGYEYIIVDKGKWNYSNNKILLDEDGLENVTQGQVSNVRQGGYGAYGDLNTPPKIESQPKSSIQFPAINGLQNMQIPEVTNTIGSGIDRTTQPIPF